MFIIVSLSYIGCIYEVCFISKSTYYASVRHKDKKMYCTLSEKWRAQATISTVFVRTAPVLSCLWGLQILAVSIFGQSCHHALHQTIPMLPINSYYTKLWQDTLYILNSRSKPLSWMFLIGTHQPKNTHKSSRKSIKSWFDLHWKIQASTVLIGLLDPFLTFLNLRSGRCQSDGDAKHVSWKKMPRIDAFNWWQGFSSFVVA